MSLQLTVTAYLRVQVTRVGYEYPGPGSEQPASLQAASCKRADRAAMNNECSIVKSEDKSLKIENNKDAYCYHQVDLNLNVRVCELGSGHQTLAVSSSSSC